jgi:hypothetical protein
MADPRDVSVSKLLSKIVCALVDRPEFVVIKTHPTEEGASFAIDVHPYDTEKIIGGRDAMLSPSASSWVLSGKSCTGGMSL